MPDLAPTDRLRQELLAIHAPDPTVVAAFEDAKGRLENLVSGGAPGSGLWAGLAALATGNRLAARVWFADAQLPADAESLAVQSYFAWTGAAPRARPAADLSRSRAAAASLYSPAIVAAAPGREGWTAFARGDAESGLRSCLANLDPAESTHGPGGPAMSERSSPAESAEPHTGRVAAPAPPAALVLPLVHGLLGAEPDAPLHRLRLAPCVPVVWDTFDAERIRVGDAEITLRYRRDGSRHTFRIEQESGAMPFTAILEPLVPGRSLAAAYVDQHAAQLDPRPIGRRLCVPVQTVLDHERTVELHVTDDEDT